MTNKVWTGLLCAGVYLSQLPFVVLLAVSCAEVEVSDGVVLAVEIFCAVTCLVTLGIGLANLIVAVLNFSKDIRPPYRLTMTAKLVLVPFFIVNFVIWALLIVGSLNPFLFFLAPLFAVFSVVSTYMIMLASGVHNMAYLLRELIKTRQIKYIFYLIAHFIFCIDVVAAIVLYIKEKERSVSR